MKLTAEQRDQIRQLLERELRKALQSTHPSDAAAVVAARRRALAALPDHPPPESP